MTVDSHFHVWDPSSRDHAWLTDIPSLNQRFSIEDYSAIAAANGVRQSILVQVLNDFDETREFLQVASEHPIIGGVVGWVDLESANIVDQIIQLREAPGGEYLVGVRHLVPSESDADYLERPNVLRGLHALADAHLVFDVLVRESQLPSALRALQKVENLSAVLDHGGNPAIAGQPTEDWIESISALAALGRVACKFSGLITAAGAKYSEAKLRPFVDHLLDTFGTERLLFGSDWPVCTLVASFEQWLELANACLSALSGSERSAIMEGNAVQLYGLANTRAI
jgi:L-fuconolactonase